MNFELPKVNQRPTIVNFYKVALTFFHRRMLCFQLGCHLCITLINAPQTVYKQVDLPRHD